MDLVSVSRFRRPTPGGIALLAAAALLIPYGADAAPVTADAFSGYAPGTNTNVAYQNGAAALGNLNGDTGLGYGALNPFNPAFQGSDLVIAGAGGSLTLHLSRNVPTNGKTLGVYVNNGYSDVSADGSGTTDGGPTTFSGFPRAVVSVSQDGVTWRTLNGGNPITFDVATNIYTDTAISGYFQPLGTAKASQSKPYLGTAAQLANSSYDQIKAAFNGSAGGNWLDLSGTGLPAVNYVKFDVPTGSRMVVDAVGGLGAANTLSAGSKVVSEDVGTGANASDVVVDFGNGHSFDFKLHYDGSISGTDALARLQAASDFRFASTHFSFGDFVTGMDYGGYVLNGDGSSGSGFWEYDVSGDGVNWATGGGASSRMLTNGSYDGWLWSLAPYANPVMPTAVPEPAALGLAALASLGLLRRRR
jgi:MYXO-CTERM domain-containing protein